MWERNKHWFPKDAFGERKNQEAPNPVPTHVAVAHEDIRKSIGWPKENEVQTNNNAELVKFWENIGQEPGQSPLSSR